MGKVRLTSKLRAVGHAIGSQAARERWFFIGRELRAFAAQLFHTGADCPKIISGAGARGFREHHWNLSNKGKYREQIGKLWLTRQAASFSPDRAPSLPTTDDADSSTILITVLSATPICAKLFALASAQINIGGVFIEIRGIRAIRTPTGTTRTELLTFRDANRATAAIVPRETTACPAGRA